MPRYRVAKELSIPRTIHRAFLCIDLQLEVLFEVVRDGFEDPIPRRLRLNIDVTVVSLANELVVSTFQFSIQIGK